MKTSKVKSFIQTTFFSAFLIAIGAQSMSAEELKLKAPKVGVEFRVDLVSNSSDLDSDEDRNDDSNSTEFVIERVTLNVDGELNDKTSYSSTIHLNKSFESENQINKSSEAIETLYIKRELIKGLDVKAGKLFVLAGSYENDYNPIDQYHYSEMFNALPSAYEVGAELDYTVAGQTFGVQLLNNSFNQGNQDTLNFNAAWYGDFANGMVQPLVTYGVYPSTKQEEDVTEGSENERIDGQIIEETESYTVSQLGVGARVNVSNFQLEAEYGSLVQPEYDIEKTGQKTEEVKEQESTLIALQGRYNAGMFQPFVKYTMDDIDEDGDDLTDFTGLSAGVEVFPETAENFRFHAVYVSKTEDPEEGDEVTRNQLNLGVSARFN
jgi:hypothetical protein